MIRSHLLTAAASIGLIVSTVPAGMSMAVEPATSDPHLHHRMHTPEHDHGIGPAGATYDLRWLDAMVEHHTGALRMSEWVFDIGAPGVGALAKQIWRDQAQEIKAMTQWRKAWYPDAPAYPVRLAPGGDPNAMVGLIRMSQDEIQAMQMIGSPPSRDQRVTQFLEAMLQHHGLNKSEYHQYDALFALP